MQVFAEEERRKQLKTVEEVTIAQHVWKSPVMQKVSDKILRTATSKGFFWPDEIDFSDIGPDDRNCIGTTFRYLHNMGILSRATAFRRSKTGSSKGRIIFAYSLRSRSLAMALLNRMKPKEDQEGYLL